MGAAMKHQAASVEELGKWARTWLASATDHHILLLEGEMGAGKTQFSQLVLDALGVPDVSSPTFNLIHTYETSQKRIHHLDLFRLGSEEELESTGFWDLLREPALFLIEWGDRLHAGGLTHAPWKVQRLHIEVLPQGVRGLTLTDLS